MHVKYLSAALIGASFLALPALAQSPNTNTMPSQQSSNSEQNASAAGLWQGSKLVGINVYDEQNEKIGDIKELMVDKHGTIEAAVIGVGGFLGMGERDVAVKFGDLKWSDQAVRSTAKSSTGSATTGAATRSATNKKANYPDHAILKTTKDQLKAMPQFNYNK